MKANSLKYVLHPWKSWEEAQKKRQKRAQETFNILHKWLTEALAGIGEAQ